MKYIYLSEEAPEPFRANVRYLTKFKPYRVIDFDGPCGICIFREKWGNNNHLVTYWASEKDPWWKTFDYPSPDGSEPDEVVRMMLMLYPEQFKE